MGRRRHLVLTVLAAVGIAALFSPSACRSKPSGGETAADASAPAEPRAEGDGDSEAPFASDDSLVEAGNRFRDAAPKVAVDPDGPIDPACSGTEIALAAAVVDKRCAIGSSRAKQLRAALEQDGGAARPLVQRASVATDGRVALRLVNSGAAQLTLPLSYSAKLPAFSVIAEDDQHALYELEPPRLDVASGTPEASAANDRPHFARVVLAPGGAAVATVTVNRAVVRVLGSRGRGAEPCADGGDACSRAGAPTRLPKGRYTLHVGELLTDVEVGAPARVVLDLP
jgi:hypothetical protein